MASLSQLLCIGVLAVMPACLGDDPDLDQPADTGAITGTKIVHTANLNDPLANSHPQPIPPKTRVKQTATGATQAPNGDTVDGADETLSVGGNIEVVRFEKLTQP